MNFGGFIGRLICLILEKELFGVVLLPGLLKMQGYRILLVDLKLLAQMEVLMGSMVLFIKVTIQIINFIKRQHQQVHWLVRDILPPLVQILYTVIQLPFSHLQFKHFLLSSFSI